MRESNKRLVAIWLILFSFALNLRGQEPRPSPAATPKPETRAAQDPDVVRITTNLVQVDVVVTKDGKQITNLKPEDFEILEDGRAQSITSFAYVSPDAPDKSNAPPVNPSTLDPKNNTGPAITKPLLPQEIKRTIAIVVDDLGMSFQSMANVRTYLRKFLSENLRQNDLIAIIRTGGEMGA